MNGFESRSLALENGGVAGRQEGIARGIKRSLEPAVAPWHGEDQAALGAI